MRVRTDALSRRRAGAGVLRVTASGVLAVVLVTVASVAAQGTAPPAPPAAQGDFAGDHTLCAVPEKSFVIQIEALPALPEEKSGHDRAGNRDKIGRYPYLSIGRAGIGSRWARRGSGLGSR